MNAWIDLSHPLDATVPLFTNDTYSDPAFNAQKWSQIPQVGFEVWQLSLGTQMGTHIDAPCHFVPGAANMRGFPSAQAIGHYHLIKAEDLTANAVLPDLGTATHVFLDARQPHMANAKTLARLIETSPLIWVMADGVVTDHDDPLWFHRALCASGRFLAEDLACDELPNALPEKGEIATVPLRLADVSGSPARVMIKL